MPRKRKKPVEKSDSATVPQDAKLYDNLYKVAKEFIASKRTSPLSLQDILSKLNLPDKHSLLFQKILDDLVAEGLLLCRDGKYLGANSYNRNIVGTLRVHPRGFGFLEADNNEEAPEDVFIPKSHINHAIDGDKVEVEILNASGPGGKGPDGRVVSIISRGRTHIAGIIRQVIGGTAVAYVPLLGKEHRVVAYSRTPLKQGDRVVMKVEEWGDSDSVTLCRVTKLLGHISDASKDTIAVIAEYELREEFPEKILAQARQIGNRVSPKEIEGRRDLREVECFTIDPDTAKDFDDALSLSKDKKGHYFLGVHIADVSHYVRENSILDKEARLRCNSTYFPRQCIPMLPSELSENLCSLKEGVNRLTVSVLVELDKTGAVVNYEIVRSAICSAKRFTYKEALLVLEGKKRSSHRPTLKLMVELCGLLKKKRAERGSIEFSLPEFVIKIDDNGLPIGFETVHYDITHQLVEEFMLKANELVAQDLAKQGKNLPYRIHDEPAEDNLKDFASLAASFGFYLPPSPVASDFQKLFEEALSTSYANYLSTAFITRMRLASYAADNIGHYGLGLTHYCHFTSPIRRYVDLVVHRLIFGAADEKQKIDLVSRHCSDQERVSAKAENDLIQIKKLRYLQGCYESDPTKQYTATITRVKNFGFYFAVAELFLEGYLHVSELEDDYYNFDPKQLVLRGANRGILYRSGQEVTVMVKTVDLITLQSSWLLVTDTENPFKMKKEFSSDNFGNKNGRDRRRKKRRRH